MNSSSELPLVDASGVSAPNSQLPIVREEKKKPPLAASSVRRYKGAIRSLEQIVGKAVTAAPGGISADEADVALTEFKPEQRRTTVCAILWKLTGEGMKSGSGEHFAWQRLLETYAAQCKIQRPIISEEEAERAASIEYDSIIERLRAENNAQNDIPMPRRVRLLQSLVVAYMSKEHGSRGQDIRLLSTSDNDRCNTVTLDTGIITLRMYKTVKTYGVKELRLSPVALKALKALHVIQGDGAFFRGADGKGFMTDSTFCNLVRKAIGTNLTTARKGMATREGNPEELDRLSALAYRMNHSLDVSRRHYQASRKRKDAPDGESTPPAVDAAVIAD